MTKEFELPSMAPTKPFLTESEIEAQFEPRTVTLKDSNGNPHQITAPVALWHWFLIYTIKCVDPDGIVTDSLKEMQGGQLEGSSLSEAFCAYMYELVRMGDPQTDVTGSGFDANHAFFVKYKEASFHPYYDELVDLQDLFDNKPRYPVPIPPFPVRTELLYEADD